MGVVMRIKTLPGTLLFFFLLISGTIFWNGCNKETDPLISVEQDDRGPLNSDLPYFVITTTGSPIVDEPKTRGYMWVYLNQELMFENNIGIELRGSSSRRLFPKLSYGIEFWDSSGADISLEILDFGKEEDWILYGPYSDKTLFRNVFIYDISNQMGRYAVKTIFAELSLNDTYQGVYVFMEKIKRDNDRLDLQPLDATMNSSSEITGGYILKIDKTSGDTDDPDWGGDARYTPVNSFRSDYGPDGGLVTYPPFDVKQSGETYFLYEYPRSDRISSEQKAYIQAFMHDFEDALLTDDFSTPERSYENYIDAGSFADHFILNELGGNPDAYRLSTFLYKDRGGKLHMGPIWDFNLAFGNDGRSQTQQWIYRYNEFYPDDLWLVHFWWNRLLYDPQFRETVKSRWMDLRADVLSTDHLLAIVDEYVDTLESNGALDRNFDTWPVIGEPLPFNAFVGATYEEEVEYMKNWIRDRTDWMDAEISSW